MDEQDNQKSKDILNVGAVAVVNADSKTEAKVEADSNGRNHLNNRIGKLAISNADEKLIEPGEHLVTVVHQHPIGLVAIYAEMVTGVLGVVVLALLAVFVFLQHSSSTVKGLIAAGTVFVIAYIVSLLMVGVYVYRQCRMLVTDKSLVQVLQHAPFSRKVSRLSMSNVEDVNFEQHGLLQSMLNYGTLTIQTAGTEDNFVFQRCPNPDAHANRILEARQAYVRTYTE